ncbi:MAG: class I SAM-dependent methyltransferase [Cyanobacteria bacterium P01_A01_bin.123]
MTVQIEDNAALRHLIRTKIQGSPEQRISFAEYMAMVLYEPQEGYYTRAGVDLGPKGDFITSAHLGCDFGELLAEQFAEIWQRLGRPQPFAVVELGAGQGLIADQGLAYLQRHYPDCLAVLNYTLVETSAELIAVQQQRLKCWQDQGVAIQWRSLAEIFPESIVGCVFSNELVDAFPVHRVQLTDSGLQEVYVTLTEDGLGFQDTLGELSTPRLADYFDRVGIALTPDIYPVGYCTEVNLAALDWLSAIASKIKQGVLITIDYGYPAHRYYGRSRIQGTLQCYYRHSHHNDPYRFMGHQDITAHVDFTALENQGEICGLAPLGMTQQSLFLMALGLGDRLTALAEITATDPASINAALQRRDSLHRLIDPMGVGNFWVLVQGKGFPLSGDSAPLKGLTVPPLG